jgi:hypothetical protein
LTLGLSGLAAVPFARAAPQRGSGAARPPLVYEFSTGGPGFSSYEKVTLIADGSVLYETSGPVRYEWTVQNRAGEFAARLDPAIYTKLVQELTRALPNGPHRTTLLPDSGRESIALGTDGGASLSRAVGDPSVTFDALAKEITSLKNTALPRPVRALELSCAKQPDTLVCRIQSVGSSPVVAPDLSHAGLFCFDRERHMQSLPPPAGLSGGQSPELAPGQALDLRFPPSSCEFHVVLQARGAHGAILVSNPLTP